MILGKKRTKNPVFTSNKKEKNFFYDRFVTDRLNFEGKDRKEL